MLCYSIESKILSILNYGVVSNVLENLILHIIEVLIFDLELCILELVHIGGNVEWLSFIQNLIIWIGFQLLFFLRQKADLLLDQKLFVLSDKLYLFIFNQVHELTFNNTTWSKCVSNVIAILASNVLLDPIDESVLNACNYFKERSLCQLKL